MRGTLLIFVLSVLLGSQVRAELAVVPITESGFVEDATFRRVTSVPMLVVYQTGRYQNLTIEAKGIQISKIQSMNDKAETLNHFSDDRGSIYFFVHGEPPQDVQASLRFSNRSGSLTLYPNLPKSLSDGKIAPPSKPDFSGDFPPWPKGIRFKIRSTDGVRKGTPLSPNVINYDTRDQAPGWETRMREEAKLQKRKYMARFKGTYLFGLCDDGTEIWQHMESHDLKSKKTRVMSFRTVAVDRTRWTSWVEIVTFFIERSGKAQAEHVTNETRRKEMYLDPSPLLARQRFWRQKELWEGGFNRLVLQEKLVFEPY